MLSMQHVRAASDLRVSFDLNENAWRVEAECCFDQEFLGENLHDPGYQTVALIAPWLNIGAHELAKRINQMAASQDAPMPLSLVLPHQRVPGQDEEDLFADVAQRLGDDMGWADVEIKRRDDDWLTVSLRIS